MDKAKYQISKGQFFIIVSLYIMANDLIRGLYARPLKQDAWIPSMISPFLSVILLSGYFLIFKINNNEDFTSSIKKTVGKPIAVLLFIIYSLYFMFVAFLNLRDIVEVISIFLLPDMAIYIIGGALLLIVLYSLYHEIEVFSRTASILFYLRVFVFFIFSALILSSNRLYFDYFLPILEHGIQPIIKPTMQMTYAIPFGELFVLLIIYQYVKNKEKNYRYGYYAILFSGLFLLLITVYNIIILGPEAMILDIRPSLRISKRIDIVFFIQRLDILIINLMIILAFIKITVLLYGAKHLLGKTFKSKNEQKISFIMFIIITVALIFFAKNYIKFLHFREYFFVPYINLVFEVILPLLIVLTAIIKKLFQIIKTPAETPS
ncbi:MAG: spore germination protein [Bacilli bacterium]|nr:spore germination protein [Bacilli bacterium]